MTPLTQSQNGQDKPPRPIKRSVTIAGHRTSFSLEEPFWRELKSIAAEQGCSLHSLVERIDEERSVNLSSALRLFVLKHLQKQRKGYLESRCPDGDERS